MVSVIDSKLSSTPRFTIIRGFSDNIFKKQNFLYFLWHLDYNIFCDTWSISIFRDNSSKKCIAMQSLTVYWSDLASIITH